MMDRCSFRRPSIDGDICAVNCNSGQERSTQFFGPCRNGKRDSAPQLEWRDVGVIDLGCRTFRNAEVKLTGNPSDESGPMCLA